MPEQSCGEPGGGTIRSFARLANLKIHAGDTRAERGRGEMTLRRFEPEDFEVVTLKATAVNLVAGLSTFLLHANSMNMQIEGQR